MLVGTHKLLIAQSLIYLNAKKLPTSLPLPSGAGLARQDWFIQPALPREGFTLYQSRSYKELHSCHQLPQTSVMGNH